MRPNWAGSACEAPHTVNLATATGAGTYTFTAAKGDHLNATFTRRSDTAAPIFAIEEVVTITGGTGRLAGATGQFTSSRALAQVRSTELWRAVTPSLFFPGTVG